MLDKLPTELFANVAEYITQQDKINLTYVSKDTYNKALPSIYQRIYLNERCYYETDMDPLIGSSRWSVLKYPFIQNFSKRKNLLTKKFQCLIRSIENDKSKLGPLIKFVHCNWHLDDNLMKTFIELLIEYGTNLQSFDNYIRKSITDLLVKKNDTLKTLTLTPPSNLPDITLANDIYYNKMYKIFDTYDCNRIETLTIHVNACTFFKKREVPLKIKSLCLNLRPDTYNTQPMDFLNPTHYYDIFDTEFLEELEILSWYNDADADLDLYEMWQLEDFLKFRNIKELILSSLFANEPFILECIKTFHSLRTLKLDYMFDIPLSKELLNVLSRSKCKNTLKYIDLKFEPLDPALLFIEQDEISLFQINLICKCEECNTTLNDIIYKKYFPTQESLVINDFSDVEDKNFLLQMFKLYPIIPYCHILGEYPPIAFNAAPISEHVAKVNSLLKHEPNEELAITETDVIKIYHAHVHSLKRTFDYFLQRFPKLQYLVLNDLPTKVLQVDEIQKCNVPIFHYENYKSNQVYELINDESLFS